MREFTSINRVMGKYRRQIKYEKKRLIGTTDLMKRLNALLFKQTIGQNLGGNKEKKGGENEISDR